MQVPVANTKYDYPVKQVDYNGIIGCLSAMNLNTISFIA